jgi:hypothetical protein
MGQCQGICQLESEGDPLLILALLLAPQIEGQLLQVLALLLQLPQFLPLQALYLLLPPLVVVLQSV